MLRPDWPVSELCAQKKARASGPEFERRAGALCSFEQLPCFTLNLHAGILVLDNTRVTRYPGCSVPEGFDRPSLIFEVRGHDRRRLRAAEALGQ